MKIKSLYIHIPFCLSKCNYCDFNSYAVNTCFEQINDYLILLRKELDLIMDQVFLGEVTTLYIGGGTPTILKTEQLCDFIIYLNDRIDFKKVKEFTIEANPGTITDEKILMLKEQGCNRLSIGAQSFDNNLLKSMGRAHTPQEIKDVFESTRKVGIKNINLDLIYGLPGQTAIKWMNSLKEVILLKPEHVAVYGLTIEKATKWGEMQVKGKLKLPDEDTVFEMYKYSQDKLKENGYINYELSNFAFAGKESLHNLTYWKNEYYLGVGLGAGSYYGAKRFYNQSNISEYLSTVEKGNRPLKEVINLTKNDEMAETVFMGLRLQKGVSIKGFNDRFYTCLFSVFKSQIRKLIDQNLLEVNGDYLRVTPKGWPVANLVFQEFV